MAAVDIEYHGLLNQILSRGFDYEDPNRKGVIRKQITSYTFEADIDQLGFPALTTKKLYWKGVVGELLWFLRGSSDIRELWKDNIHIWDKDWHNHSSKNHYISSSALNHSVGRIYGAQWRKWYKYTTQDYDERDKCLYDRKVYLDQISNLIEGLKKTPMGTRHIVTAWNPAELDNMALPPCHWSFEILVQPLSPVEIVDQAKKDGLWRDSFKTFEEGSKQQNKFKRYGFTLKWHQRSVDTFLGLPFNIASYGLLAHIIGAATNMKPLKLIGDLSNVHIYEPHLNQVKTQLSRSVGEFQKTTLKISNNAKKILKQNNINEAIPQLEIKDFTLPDYKSYPAIKAEMLPYNK